MSAINLLVKAGIPVRIICTVQRSNQDVVPEIVELAKQAQVGAVYFNAACDLGRAHPIRDRVCLSPTEHEVLVQQITRIRENSKADSQIIEFKRTSRNGIFIDYNGDVYPRASHEDELYLLGYLFVDGLSEL
jgi:MoaA/NifB/PqqE/SkfB family radical SAM enzyme